MNSYKEDKIENEKSDPLEGSSLKVINVPLVLIALLLGFGITYLALQTDEVSMQAGDSRTKTDNNKELKKDKNDGIEAIIAQGKQIYTSTCQACHQANGKGITGTFPPLANSKWVNGPPKRLIAIITHGLQGEIKVNGNIYNNIMPAFGSQLSNNDLFAVATYIRKNFGNNSEPVDLKIVEQSKDLIKNKTSLWSGEKELNKYDWN